MVRRGPIVKDGQIFSMEGATNILQPSVPRPTQLRKSWPVTLGFLPLRQGRL